MQNQLKQGIFNLIYSQRALETYESMIRNSFQKYKDRNIYVAGSSE